MSKKSKKLHKLVVSTKFRLGMSFAAGFGLGYVLGSARIHQFLSFRVPNIPIDWLSVSWFGQITPNPTFLSDVAAFGAVIIAFLVPLSIEIISKISERYNSDVITRSFEDNLENRLLPPLLLISIVGAIILRFIVHEDADSVLWKIVAWIVLLIFISIAFAIWRVINRIKLFMTNTEFVLDQLYEDVQEAIS